MLATLVFSFANSSFFRLIFPNSTWFNLLISFKLSTKSFLNALTEFKSLSDIIIGGIRLSIFTNLGSIVNKIRYEDKTIIRPKIALSIFSLPLDFIKGTSLVIYRNPPQIIITIARNTAAAIANLYMYNI